jgi:hypothetical protein
MVIRQANRKLLITALQQRNIKSWLEIHATNLCKEPLKRNAMPYIATQQLASILNANQMHVMFMFWSIVFLEQPTGALPFSLSKRENPD